MNKNPLIILLTTLVLVLVGIGILFYYQSFKNVTLNFKQPELSVTIYQKVSKDKQAEVGKFTESGQVRLQSGTYTVVPSGNLYSPEPIEFKVEKEDITIDVNPNFSSSYRKSLLAEQLSTIKSVIVSAYPDVIDGFVINDGEIYEQGQWYATTLVQKAQGSDEGDVYRMVLKKENDKWKIVARPALVLSIKTYPNIPKDILSSVNAKD